MLLLKNSPLKNKPKPYCGSANQLQRLPQTNWQTLCKISPAMLACVTSGGRLKYAKHWRAIDKALMDMMYGKIRKLIINVPPQFGKSELASKYLPAWFLGNFPQKKIILVSYESDYAASWGYKAREVYNEYAKLIWGPDSSCGGMQTRDWWETSLGGYMVTGGMLASVTGKGADILIIDDPHKNSSEAHSKKMRDKIWDNYLATYLTRLQPGGCQIIIQTRWHSDDLTGRILKLEGDEWTKIILPALNEDETESLFPERYSVAELLDKKKTMGSYIFNSLYQQKPSPPEGGMFKKKWFKKWFRLPDKFDRIINSWDLSEADEDSTEEGSSFQDGGVFGVKGADIYLLDLDHDKTDFPEQVRRIKALKAKHANTRAILIEKKSTGKAAIDTIKKDIPGVVAIMPTESKEARASAISYIIEAGNFYLPGNDEKMYDLVIDQMVTFPNGDNNDIVDMISQALNYIHNQPRVQSSHKEDL